MNHQTYQGHANVVVGFMLHDILLIIPDMEVDKVASLRAKLWGRLDAGFKNSDYDFDESHNIAIDGFADDMDVLKFDDVQVRSFSGLLSGVLKKHFDDVNGNR